MTESNCDMENSDHDARPTALNEQLKNEMFSARYWRDYSSYGRCCEYPHIRRN